jgi:hypothetical protein
VSVYIRARVVIISLAPPGTSPWGWSTAAPMMKNARVEKV